MRYHIPVLAIESIEELNITPGGVYVDLTFGGGGHSRAILSKLNKKGRLLAFDQDMDAEVNSINDPRFTFIHSNFRFMKNFLKYYRIEKVNGIMADLGISSYQVDNPSRGFTYMADTNLDMRMNKDSGMTASDVLNTYSESELCRVFKEYGEVNNYKKLTNLILNMRSSNTIVKTNEFISGISTFLPPKNSYNMLAKIFQALRIEVNDEIGALKEMLLQLPEHLVTGGRVIILTYHSLEDRLVKNFFKSGNFQGILDKDFYGNVITPLRPLYSKVITPSREEVMENKRSRSAKLRIAEKL